MNKTEILEKYCKCIFGGACKSFNKSCDELVHICKPDSCLYQACASPDRCVSAEEYYYTFIIVYFTVLLCLLLIIIAKSISLWLSPIWLNWRSSKIAPISPSASFTSSTGPFSKQNSASEKETLLANPSVFPEQCLFNEKFTGISTLIPKNGDQESDENSENTISGSLKDAY